MARNDIRPFASDSGGTTEIKATPLATGAAFRQGEPVVFSSGAVVEASDDPPEVFGIAVVDASPTAVSPFVRFTQAVGTPIQVYERSGLWQCDNFATDGAGTLTAPTQANAIGLEAGFTLASGAWIVDTGTANLHVAIEQVLDAHGRSVTDPLQNNGAGTTVVFRWL